VASSFRVELSDGTTVFAKTHRAPPPLFFSTEAAGLAWLAEARTVAVPEVMVCSDDPPFLVLEWIDEGVDRPGTDEAFGSALAGLHRSGAPAFGRQDRRTTTSRRLPNDPCESWVEFFATRRLLPLARLAREAAALDDHVIRRVESVAARLDRLVGPVDVPARLHGDLWAGNRLVDTEGTSWLIDPAAFGGDREFDLAMMLLFGGFGAASFDAYDEAWPLANDWQQRMPLYQLAPLITHAIKFGGSYVRAVSATLAALE
jgi:fructosamine-3-kinase